MMGPGREQRIIAPPGTCLGIIAGDRWHNGAVSGVNVAYPQQSAARTGSSRCIATGEHTWPDTMAATDVVEQTDEPEVSSTEDAAPDQPLSKSAKKRAKQKAKKAAENGSAAETPAESGAVSEQPAASTTAVDGEEAESADEDEADAAGAFCAPYLIRRTSSVRCMVQAPAAWASM